MHLFFFKWPKNAGMIDMSNLCSLLLQARIKKFFKSKVGGGVEEENFERKMFVDTLINACTRKN